ncbi:hypothetical protein [Streptomyces sp. NPDC002588]|uniref:hypothetical protein n=1 Tax=Streptomyces sp. NPDC002588 TaxID=3154419 RepID=UPI00332DA1E5
MENDPHIHVRKSQNTDLAARGMLAATFGLVADPPSTVTTGCGLRVPYAMTSQTPESVTCLPCREHAHVYHLRAAERLELLGSAPHGLNVDAEGVRTAVERLRDLARRFAAGG